MGSLFSDMAVDLPEGTRGRVEVRRFEVKRDVENLLMSMQGRGCRPGIYTALYRSGRLWMSDTDAERMDHLTPALEMARRGGRVLVGGLGLGMIVRAALLQEGVQHVDVVEVDEDVAALVGTHYQRMAEERGKTMAVHVTDVFEMKWPQGSRWSVAWFDVWPDLCTDNLESMARLRRSYGKRADWCDCWGRQLLLRKARTYA